MYSLIVDGGQRLAKYLTGSAQLHFFLPGIVNRPITDGSVDEPAQIAGGELPGRALLPPFQGAGSPGPARFCTFFTAQFSGKQKIELTFHVHGNRTPPLLIAMNGLDGRPQKLSHLFLGFFQLFAKYAEIFGIHGDWSLLEGPPSDLTAFSSSPYRDGEAFDTPIGNFADATFM
jgi:hypothetical protein